VTPSRILLVVARLKLILTLRYFSRHMGSALGMVVGLFAMSGLAVAGGVFLMVTCQAGGPAFRDPALIWACWILSLLWLSAPFMQFDAQRNIDLNGLRLLPVSRQSFTLAVLLDAALSPLGIFFVILSVVAIAAFSLDGTDVLIVAVVIGLLWVCWLSLGQAIFLWANRLLQSRRFTDASIVIGVLIFVIAQSANLMIQSADDLAVPAWLTGIFSGFWAAIRPLVHLLFPGAAASAIAALSAGEWGAGFINLGLLGIQCLACWWLAGTAVRQFYEGELESGGEANAPVKVQRSGTSRWGVAAVTGVLGALFHRERLYLWRDPTMKMLQMQSLFGAAYFVIMALVFRFNFGEGARISAQSDYAILFLALVLSFVESGLMFNKFGYEGSQLVNVLVSPVSRTDLLRSKSLYSMTHFGGVNVVLVTGLAMMLKPGLPYAVAAVVMVITNTAVVDVIGHFVSIYFPFGYARRGRRIRAVMPQPGCGYMLLYTLVFQAANLAVLPASLSLGLGVVFYGWAGLLAGTLVAALILYLAYRVVLPMAASHLERREPELLNALARSHE